MVGRRKFTCIVKMESLDELEKDNLRQILEEELQSIQIEFLFVFGSSVQNPTPLSDVDICVSLPDYEDLDSHTKLSTYSNILDMLQRTLRREDIDLSIYETLPLRVKYQVLKHGELIYKKSDQYLQECYYNVQKYYPDNKRWIREQLDQIEKVAKL